MAINKNPHRPLFKVIINSLLRFCQPYTQNKFVLISHLDKKSKILFYSFGKVYHYSDLEMQEMEKNRNDTC